MVKILEKVILNDVLNKALIEKRLHGGQKVRWYLNEQSLMDIVNEYK